MTPFRSRNGSGSRSVLIALFFLLLVLFLFFFDILAGDDALITANMSRWLPWRTTASPGDLDRPTFRDDSAITYYPRRHLSDQELDTRRVPHWNRYILCGTPHLADFQSAVFHPLNLALHFVEAKRATALFLVVHLFLGGFFLFLFLRRMRIGLAGSLIGAVSFLFNAYFATYLGHPVHISTGCWIPMILLLVADGMEGRRRALWLPLAVSLMILGGFPQTILYTLMIAGGWALFLWWRKPHGERMKGAGNLAMLGLMMALAFGLVLFQLLPTREIGSLSERSAIDLDTILEHHQPSPYSAIRMALPDFYGNPVSENYWLRAVEGPLPHPNDLGFIGYGGVIPLILALFAVIFCRRKKVLFFAGIAAAALLLAFSPHVYSLYYKAIPFARFSSELHRLQFPFLFALAVLAGFGFQELAGRSRHPGKVRAAVLFLVGVITVLPIAAIALQTAGPAFLDFAAEKMIRSEGDIGRQSMLVPPMAVEYLSGNHGAWLRHQWAGMGRLLFFAGLGSLALLVLLRKAGSGARIATAALLLLATADGWIFARLYYTPQSADSVYSSHELLDRLESKDVPFRTGRLTRQYFLPSNSGLPYGIEDIAGVNALMPARYGRIFHAISPPLFPDGRRIAPFRDPSLLRLPIWDLLNLRFVLVGPTFDLDRVAEAACLPDNRGRWEQVWRTPFTSPFSSMALLENRSTLPRAFLSHTYQVVDRPEEILRRIVAPDFTPSGPIYLEKSPPFPSGSVPRLDEDECRVVRYDNSRIVVETKSPEESLLFLSENDYPGWEAEVDGQVTPILRANYTFRAVPLEPGEHTITFRYTAGPFRKGLAGSAIALAGYMTLIVAVLARRKKTRAVCGTGDGA